MKVRIAAIALLAFVSGFAPAAAGADEVPRKTTPRAI